MQATKNARFQENPFSYISFADQGVDKNELLEKANVIINNPEESEMQKMIAQKLLVSLSEPSSIEEVFKDATSTNAIQYITNKASDYHFTLINEAHYNSQHRNFTENLLEPLWFKGYRYLALETFSHEDYLLENRGYPTNATGYYTEDPNLGNVVREALKIGYKMIPYETIQYGNSGTVRDADQARNIYEKTSSKDKKGKVLVHAGYSHIMETGSSQYEPMGYQLKELVGQDILTIDQVEMVALHKKEKMHHYYVYADSAFKIDEPTIFLNKESKVLVEPVNNGSIDIQIYHPPTNFIKGRPDWLMSDSKVRIPLPEKIKEYKGFLIQALLMNESNDAIPLDKFVINNEKELILPTGRFKIQIINCEGALIKEFQLEVNI